MPCRKCGGKLTGHGDECETMVGFSSHNDNCLIRAYVCENGHIDIYSVRRRCSCGWVGKAECWCHSPREKVDEWPAVAAHIQEH